MKQLFKQWWWAAAIAFAVFVGVVLFAVNNGVTNGGNTRQAGLNAQYENNINVLSDCVVRIRETAGIAKGEVGALEKIITEAVKGRYDKGSTAAPQGGALFSAILEAYPNLSGLSGTFDKVLTIASGCRTDYRGEQAKLLSMIEAFERWQTGSLTVRLLGKEFPTKLLRARRGEQVLRAEAALEQMRTVVVIADAAEAYETGKITTEDPFAEKK